MAGTLGSPPAATAAGRDIVAKKSRRVDIIYLTEGVSGLTGQKPAYGAPSRLSNILPFFAAITRNKRHQLAYHGPDESPAAPGALGHTSGNPSLIEAPNPRKAIIPSRRNA